jgi:hypothetical protein
MLAVMEEFQLVGVFNRCSMYQALETGTIKLSPTIPIPGWTWPIPSFFVADDTFAMRYSCPFKDQLAPNRIFSYQFSTTCRIVGNVFGIITNRSRVPRKPMIQNP